MDRTNTGNFLEKKLRDIWILKIVNMANIRGVPRDNLFDPRDSLFCKERGPGMKIHKKFKILTGILNPLPGWMLVRIVIKDHDIGVTFLFQHAECIEKELFDSPNWTIPITNMKNIHRMGNPVWNFVSSVGFSSLVKNAK